MPIQFQSLAEQGMPINLRHWRTPAERLTTAWIFLLAITCAGAATQPVQWQAGPGYRYLGLPPLASGKPGFSAVPPTSTGISFTNLLTQERTMLNANLLNGSGVALGDYDADGLCDIYLCNLNGTNALFRNLGDWRFTNTTQSAGVACPGQTPRGQTIVLFVSAVEFQRHS